MSSMSRSSMYLRGPCSCPFTLLSEVVTCVSREQRCQLLDVQLSQCSAQALWLDAQALWNVQLAPCCPVPLHQNKLVSVHGSQSDSGGGWPYTVWAALRLTDICCLPVAAAAGTSARLDGHYCAASAKAAMPPSGGTSHPCLQARTQHLAHMNLTIALCLKHTVLSHFWTHTSLQHYHTRQQRGCHVTTAAAAASTHLTAGSCSARPAIQCPILTASLTGQRLQRLLLCVGVHPPPAAC